MTDSRYLKLLWTYLALTVTAIVAGLFPNHSETLQLAYDNEPATWLMSNIWLMGLVFGGLVITWLVGFVGLFFFKRWARSLSLYSTLAGFLIYPLMGAPLSSGLEAALFEASTTIWGAILALSYFSAVDDRFGANSSFKPNSLRESA